MYNTCLCKSNSVSTIVPDYRRQAFPLKIVLVGTVVMVEKVELDWTLPTVPTACRKSSPTLEKSVSISNPLTGKGSHWRSNEVSCAEQTRLTQTPEPVLPRASLRDPFLKMGYMVWLPHCRHKGVSGPGTGIFDIYLCTKYLMYGIQPHTNWRVLPCSDAQYYSVTRWLTDRAQGTLFSVQGTSCQHRSPARRAGLFSETAVKQEPAQIRNGRAQTTALTQLQYNRVQDKTRQGKLSL